METRTFATDGIKHLIIEQMAPDARVRGEPAAGMVQVTYQVTEQVTGPDFAVEGETLYFRGRAAARVTLPTELTLTVYEAAGELRVQALAGPITIETVAGDLRLMALKGRTQIGRVGGSLRAESVANLRIVESCTGDLRVQDGDSLSVGLIRGDVRLYGLRTARLGQVQGDLWVEKLGGALEVIQANGDVRLSEIGGLATVQGVAGDLRASGLAGGLLAQGVLGDGDLHGSLSPEPEYSLAAAGDITLDLPLDADLRLTAQAGGRIRSDVLLIPTADGSAVFTAILGRASGRVTLKSGGDLRITQTDGGEGARIGARAASGGETPNWSGGAGARGGLGDLSDQIRQQVSASLAAVGIDLAGGQLNLDAAVAGPGRPAREARETRGPRAPRPAGADRYVPPERPQWPEPPVRPSADEQLAVLKMLEAGTISPGEAEVLFKALGG